MTENVIIVFRIRFFLKLNCRTDYIKFRVHSCIELVDIENCRAELK